jgi:hypothetical protein
MSNVATRSVGGSVLLYLLASTLECFSASKDHAAPIVVLGIGITNQIEIGMTLKQVKRKSPNVIVTTEYERSTGIWRFWPWKHAVGHVATVPALGATFRTASFTSPITEVDFLVLPSLSSNRFNGLVSCGLSFGQGKPVLREDVVRVMGQPLSLGTNSLFLFLRTGKTFSWRPDANTEMIYYPQVGAAFRLLTNIVETVRVSAPFTSKEQNE